MIKKIIIITVWVLLVAGLGVFISFTEKQHNAILCDNLSVLIKYNSEDYFLIDDDILEHLSSKGFVVKGSRLSDINAGDIETSLNTIPYVESADVYVSIEGDVFINIIQRRPILKVYNKSNQCYYVDDKGRLFPGSDKYTARLIIANGEIREYYAPFTSLEQDSLDPDTAVVNSPLYKVYMMAKYIDGDPFWKAMIEEIYVNNKNELELFTKIGDAVVIFGDIDDMDEKFEKLYVFYKEGLGKYGWSKYKRINLKFKNQVVCSKT